MSKKDIEYTFRPIKFIDDPYYFLAKAFKIRKNRKKFRKQTDNINQEIDRLRLFIRRPMIEEEELLTATKKLENLENQRIKNFDHEFKKKAQGVDLQAYHVERNILIAQKVVHFPFKILVKIFRKF